MNLIYNLVVLIDNLTIRLLMVHKTDIVRFRRFPDKNDTLVMPYSRLGVDQFQLMILAQMS
jgi:hypothetical protein